MHGRGKKHNSIWEDNIEMNLKEIIYEDVDCIQLTKGNVL